MNLLITILYMVFVFIVSVIKPPGGMAPFNHFDKLVHFVLYFIMALLWVRVFKGQRRRRFGTRPKRVFLKALVLTFFYGLFIELAQSFVPVREASFFDAAANGLGAGVGVFCYAFFYRRT